VLAFCTFGGSDLGRSARAGIGTPRSLPSGARGSNTHGPLAAGAAADLGPAGRLCAARRVSASLPRRKHLQATNTLPSASGSLSLWFQGPDSIGSHAPWLPGSWFPGSLVPQPRLHSFSSLLAPGSSIFVSFDASFVGLCDDGGAPGRAAALRGQLKVVRVRPNVRAEPTPAAERLGPVGDNDTAGPGRAKPRSRWG
jgi:hypothetical protein